MNNTIFEIKNNLEGTNSRVTKTEERISVLENRIVEINEAEQKKKKKSKINEINEDTMFRDSWDSNKHQTFKPQLSQKKTKGKGMRKYLRKQ